MKLYEHNQEELKTIGGTLIKSAIAPDVALEWAEKARSNISKRVSREAGAAKDLDEGGARFHGIAAAKQTQQILPELFGVYQAYTTFLSALIDRPVVTSPYAESAVTLKVYDQPGDSQGWHKDTNPFTALLILTETTGTYGTEIEGLDGSRFNLENEPGDMWLMYGRELRHRVPSVPEGKWRVTVPFNYYHPDDFWRPEGMDELVYGNDPV